MQRLYIPACGDRLTLTGDWVFTLYLERRNVEFAKSRGLVPDTFGTWDGHVYDQVARKASLEYRTANPVAGTVLECDRIYVRTFNKSRVHEGEDYDSITWKVIGKNDKAVRHGRFWVKLSACGDVAYSQEPGDLYRNRVKAVRAVLES
jgi:hypothetical protein